jgi:heterodisulfide reductase subunit A
MKIGLYICHCGTNITASVDAEKVAAAIAAEFPQSYCANVEFICSDEGKTFFKNHLLEQQPDRVVVAACSPREYENTFMQILAEVGINPYFLQFVNIREQVAWVTPDPIQATGKATIAIRAAMARVQLQQPLHKQEVEANPSVLVIGAGPAGIQCAQYLAEAGRKVVLVEKTAALGGKPVLFEELFPTMECGPCLLEPVQAEILHGNHAHNIEILLLSQVEEVNGYFGNFTAKIKRSPRYIDNSCIGCGMCVEACPASIANDFNCGMNDRKAIDMPFLGALPNIPFIDPRACMHIQGDSCQLCLESCPVPEAILFDDKEEIIERKVGAIVIATGATLYECRQVPELGYGQVPGVYTSLEFERLAAANGPTAGEIKNSDGKAPECVSIVHCVGSLDRKHQPHCSGICCEYALKFNRIVEHKLPGTKVVHFYKELVVPGKESFTMLEHARSNPHAQFIRCKDIASVQVTASDGVPQIAYQDIDGNAGSLKSDMVVLCPAMVGGEDSGSIGKLMDLDRNSAGFFEELNGKLHSAQSKVKGIYIAGSCQAPMNIRETASQSMAAAGYILSALVEGKKLVVEPITASVNEEQCSGCRVCGSVCPYNAISYLPESHTSSVNALLCHGCGTCVAACPSGAMRGNHFTDDQILAEIEAILQ